MSSKKVTFSNEVQWIPAKGLAGLRSSRTKDGLRGRVVESSPGLGIASRTRSSRNLIEVDGKVFYSQKKTFNSSNSVESFIDLSDSENHTIGTDVEMEGLVSNPKSLGACSSVPAINLGAVVKTPKMLESLSSPKRVSFADSLVTIIPAEGIGAIKSGTLKEEAVAGKTSGKRKSIESGEQTGKPRGHEQGPFGDAGNFLSQESLFVTNKLDGEDNASIVSELEHGSGMENTVDLEEDVDPNWGDSVKRLQRRLIIATNVVILFRNCIKNSGHELPTVWGSIDCSDLDTLNGLQGRPDIPMWRELGRMINCIRQLGNYIRVNDIPYPGYGEEDMEANGIKEEVEIADLIDQVLFNKDLTGKALIAARRNLKRLENLIEASGKEIPLVKGSRAREFRESAKIHRGKEERELLDLICRTVQLRDALTDLGIELPKTKPPDAQEKSGLKDGLINGLINRDVSVQLGVDSSSSQVVGQGKDKTGES